MRSDCVAEFVLAVVETQTGTRKQCSTGVEDERYSF